MSWGPLVRVTPVFSQSRGPVSSAGPPGVAAHLVSNMLLAHCDEEALSDTAMREAERGGARTRPSGHFWAARRIPSHHNGPNWGQVGLSHPGVRGL
jgi:hypothetical protein